MQTTNSLPARQTNSRWILLPACVIFFLFLAYRIFLIFYPQPNIGGVENNVIYFIQRLIDGRPFYTDPEKTPWAIAQYSPLYYFIVSGVSKLFGLKADDVLNIYEINRIVSLVFNLLYILLVYFITLKIFSSSNLKSVLAAIATFIFLEITSYGRPDSLNHLMFMSSFYLFLKWVRNSDQKKQSSGLLILCATVSAVALFSKQTSFILPVIFFLWLIKEKKFRPAVIYTISYLATAVFLLIVFQRATGGLNLMFKNAVMGINNGIWFGWFWELFVKKYYLGVGGLLLMAAILVAFKLRKKRSDLFRFSLFALVSLFVLLNVVALKFGSHVGYFTEWWTFLFILIACFWPEMHPQINWNKAVIGCLILAVGIKIFQTGREAKYFLSDRPYSTAMNSYKAEKQLADSIRINFKDSSNNIFCNYYTPDYFMSCFLFRQAIMPQMEIVGLATYPMKQYNYTEFEQALDSGKIEWMLMRANGPQKQFFQKKLDYFKLESASFGFNIYRFQK